MTMFPAFMKNGTNSTIADYVETINDIISIAGEGSVGIGTDFTQGHDVKFFEWVTKDKGYGRPLVAPKPVKFPPGIETIAGFPTLTTGMEKAGWPASKIEKVIGKNWLTLLETVWGACAGGAIIHLRISINSGNVETATQHCHIGVAFCPGGIEKRAFGWLRQGSGCGESAATAVPNAYFGTHSIRNDGFTRLG